MAQLSPVPPITKLGFADPVWARWLQQLRQSVIATIASFRIATANGFQGTTTTDASGNAVVTLSVTVSGLLKGSGGALVSAVANVDYVSSIALTGDASGVFSAGNLPVTLAATGVTAGTYGSTSSVARITVDAKGRVTSASSVTIAPVPIAVGSTAARPASPPNGTQYLDTDLQQPIWALGGTSTGWINSAGVSV